MNGAALAGWPFPAFLDGAVSAAAALAVAGFAAAAGSPLATTPVVSALVNPVAAPGNRLINHVR